MHKFHIISCVPELLESPFAHSIVRRAVEKKFAEIKVIDLREYGMGKHYKVDDYQYGGGAGMLLSPVPLGECIEVLCAMNKYDEVIYMSPDGELLSQPLINQMSLKNNYLIICGHYKGIDQRIRDLYITKEISVGDYVVSGGELPAALLVDAVIRLIPGVIGDETSALEDSFQDGLLAPPAYTRPKNYKGLEVPDILLGGHEAKIAEWRYNQAIEKTEKFRPELLNDRKNI